MYKDYRYINAGENEFYRWGKKAQERIIACMEPRNGFYSIPVDGGNYYTLGTSKGKYGEFMKWNGTIFSVNTSGYAWAKAGTEKAEKFIEMLNRLVGDMKKRGAGELEED